MKKSKGIKKEYTEINNNKNTMIQNLWDTEKAVIAGKYIAIQSHLKKQTKKSQISNLILHIKQLEKERRMELEESTYLTSGSTTKPQLSRQYGTGTKTEI